MGGGPGKEVILIALSEDEPVDLVKTLRKQHPHHDIRYVQTGSPLSASDYADVTVLVTFSALPKDPADAPKLSLLQLFSAGSNHISTHPLYTFTSIPIATASGIHGPQIAEWVILTTLAHSHAYNALHDLQRAHKWGKKEPGNPFVNVRDRVGQRIGVLGYGSIGRQVGRVAAAMGMDVVAFTASERKTPESKRDGGFVVPGTGDVEGKIPSEWFHGLDRESLHRFLKQELDVLLVAVPLTEQTRGFLGTEEFKVLSGDGERKSLVVNIARGQIINQDELITALKDGTLGGAALDVTDPEPLPEDSELWGLENVIVTPHVSGVSERYAERGFQLLDQQLTRKEKGEKLYNIVQRKRGY